MSTSLKHRRLRVLHHHLLELLQEQLQVLTEKEVGEDSVVGEEKRGQVFWKGVGLGEMRKTIEALTFKEKMPMERKAYSFFWNPVS